MRFLIFGMFAFMMLAFTPPKQQQVNFNTTNAIATISEADITCILSPTLLIPENFNSDFFVLELIPLNEFSLHKHNELSNRNIHLQLSLSKLRFNQLKPSLLKTRYLYACSSQSEEDYLSIS